VRLHEIYKNLTNRHDITVVTGNFRGASPKEKDGIRYEFLGCPVNLRASVVTFPPAVWRYLIKKSKDFDIIVEDFSPLNPVLSPVFTRRPVLSQIQIYMGREFIRRYGCILGNLLLVAERLSLKIYRYFIIISDTLFIRFKRCISKKSAVYIVPNGVSEDILNYSNTGKETHILYIGRFDIGHKGLDVIFEAVEELKDDIPIPPVLLVGDGPDIKKIKNILNERDLKGRIELIGKKTGEEKLKLIKNAYFLLMPSRYEGMPLVALEAGAMGKPIIVSDIPELKFAVEAGYGVSFPLNKPETLKNIMLKLLGDTRLRRELGRKGREYTKGLTWGKVAGEFERVILNITEEDNYRSKGKV